MRAGITWYDLLGALPDASSEDIQRAYDVKAGVLRPELLSSAPPTVVTAAARARGVIDAAQRVLGDPVRLQRYNEAAWPGGQQWRPGPAQGLPRRGRAAGLRCPRR